MTTGQMRAVATRSKATRGFDSESAEPDEDGIVVNTSAYDHSWSLRYANADPMVRYLQHQKSFAARVIERLIIGIYGGHRPW